MNQTVNPTTRTNPADILREALAGRSAIPLPQLIQQLRAAGMTAAELAKTFGNLGIAPEMAAGILGASTGTLGKGEFIADYAAALGKREGAAFIERTGYGSAGQAENLGKAAAVRTAKELADHFGSLAAPEAGRLISAMLFTPGNDAFWDRMAETGKIHHDTAEDGKRMAGRLPAERERQRSSMEAALDDAHLSPEDRAKAEAFKSSKKAKELADEAARIQLLKEHEERARRNGDLEYAKKVEEERKRLQQQYEARLKEIAQSSPDIAAALKDHAVQNGLASRELAATEKLTAEQSGNIGMVNVTTSFATGGTDALVKKLLEDRSTREAAAKALISGSEESKFQTGKAAATQAIALGIVGEKEIASSKDAVALVEAKKEATVAAKGSSDLKASDSDDMFGSAPPINVAALDKMRAQRTEGASQPAKVASMVG